LAAKKSSRKKSTRKSASRLGGMIDKDLGDLSKRIEKQVRELGRDLDRAQVQAARRAARLLHQARSELNKVPVKGTSDWHKFLRDSKRDLSGLLAKLEKTLRTSSRKTTGRKKGSRKKIASA
jgi:ElaB/YqjD/DUF883 family membrane-anchored ribosome-binding protein